MPFNKLSDVLSLDSVLGERSGDSWVLREPVTYQVPKSKTLIQAPAGMLFDLASFPPFVKPFLNNDDPRVRRAAAIHDHIYYQKGEMPPFEFTGEIDGYAYKNKLQAFVVLSRAQADGIFYSALVDEGYPVSLSVAARIGLFIGSWVPWMQRKTGVADKSAKYRGDGWLKNKL